MHPAAAGRAGRVSPARERRRQAALSPASGRSSRSPGCSRRSPRSGPRRCSGSPARSVRLLRQLPRVEALGGGKARRREGRGGTNAARSLPRGGAGVTGARGASTSRLRRPPARPPARGRLPAGERRVPESGDGPMRGPGRLPRAEARGPLRPLPRAPRAPPSRLARAEVGSSACSSPRPV